MKNLITVSHKGDFSKTTEFLSRLVGGKYLREVLSKYGERGVEALSGATPKDTGLTASSWSYRIVESGDSVSIEWLNSNFGDNWAPIAIMLQYGHATGTGGWVEGRDYINPAMRPIFDEMAQLAWKEVTIG